MNKKSIRNEIIKVIGLIGILTIHELYIFSIISAKLARLLFTIILGANGDDGDRLMSYE